MSKIKKDYRIDTNVIQEHYLFWCLNRVANQSELELLKSIMIKIGAEHIRTTNERIVYRYFFDNNKTVSVHILGYRKSWGISINIHVDIGVHHHGIFTDQTLKILKIIKNFLINLKHGYCFLLPAEEKQFVQFKKNQKFCY